MREYVKNRKKYVKNMKEYEEICQYIGCIWPWDLEKFRTPPYLEKFHVQASSWALGHRKILSSASIQTLGFEKMLGFPFCDYSLLAEHRA